MHAAIRFLQRFPRLYTLLRGVKRVFVPPAPPPSLPGIERGTTKRLLFFQRLLEQVDSVQGDVVLCGVGDGHDLLYLTLLCRAEEKGRQIWGFDPFGTAPDTSPTQRQSGNPHASLLRVRALLEASGVSDLFMRTKVVVAQGAFAGTVSKYAGQGIALLYVNVSSDRDSRDVLETLYDDLLPDGIVGFERLEGEAGTFVDGLAARDLLALRVDSNSGHTYGIRPRRESRQEQSPA